jgi:uncharacterized protein YcfJ
MKHLFILILVGIYTISYSDYLPGQGSVFMNGQEYRPVQNDYVSVPSNTQNQIISAPTSSVQENCWYEQVPITNSTADESPNVGGAIVGGIIGGVIGHQFGSGSGKAAATIGGAVLGTAMGATPQSTSPRYQTVRKCNTVR